MLFQGYPRGGRRQVNGIGRQDCFCIGHCQRPESVIRRQLPGWEVEYIAVLVVEFLFRAVFHRRPVHRLFRRHGSPQHVMGQKNKACLRPSPNGPSAFQDIWAEYFQYRQSIIPRKSLLRRNSYGIMRDQKKLKNRPSEESRFSAVAGGGIEGARLI